MAIIIKSSDFEEVLSPELEEDFAMTSLLFSASLG
jgi:hypothetical protein